MQIVSQCALFWNTEAFLLPFSKNMVDLQNQAEVILKSRKLVKKGDLILVISGTTPVKGATNFVRVKKVGEE